MTIDRSCGPDGCQLDWLVSPRLEVDADPVAVAKFATDSGWVYAVNRATGRLVDDREEPTGWKFPLEQDVSGGLLFDGRFLYAGGSDGYVYAFDEQGNP